MRAFVTGAAGFIGSRLSERLLEAGRQVVGVDSLTDYYSPELKRRNLEVVEASDRFQLVPANLRELDWAEWLSPGDIVFHLAGQPGVRRSWGSEFRVYLDENVLATQMLLEAAKPIGLDRIVVASSSSVYGDAETLPTPESVTPAPVSPYGVSKLAVEHLCRLYATRFDVPVLALRYFTVYGPRQRPDMAFDRFIRAALSGGRIEVFGDGHQSRDFTYVDDIVAATIAAAEKGSPGEVYNVAGGSRASVRDVLGALEATVGTSLDVDYGPSLPGDARHTAADTSKARDELGYAASVDLDAGLARQVEAVRRAIELADVR